MAADGLMCSANAACESVDNTADLIRHPEQFDSSLGFQDAATERSSSCVSASRSEPRATRK